MKHLFEGRILTVPNLLSVIRLLLIPWIVWLYLGKQDRTAAAAVFLCSGLTDAADGYIARRFDQVSNLGKALDPLADKLTQLAVGLCLLHRWPLFRLLCAELAVKEIVVGLILLSAIRSSGQINSADWHGKVSTALMSVTMTLHFFWQDIPDAVSSGLIFGCMAMMLLSGVLYCVRFLRISRERMQ